MRHSFPLFVLLLFGYGAVHAQKNVVVAQDGSGDYKTVQAALDAVPMNNVKPFNIYIKNGVYHEKLHLDTSKAYVNIIGEDAGKTILTYDDHTGKILPSGDTVNTMTSYTFLINADHFTAKDITIRNDAGSHAGQAVGLDVKGDEVAFIHCRIRGDQDILFAQSPDSREFYKDCYIEGTTDFIFGAATAYFDRCEIHCKKNSHITAASTPADHAFGFVFNACKITGDPGIVKADLGRPWRDYAAVVYLYCDIGNCIIPQGWSNWNNTERYKTARFSEFKDRGPGADAASRVHWSFQLNDVEAAAYTIKNVLNGWIPEE